MHTVGAIILGVISVLLMQTGLGFVTKFVFSIMHPSVGSIPPTLIGIGLTGCAYFGGLYFSLSVVPHADPKVTTWIMIVLTILSALVGIADLHTIRASTVALIIAGGTAAVVGLFIGQAVIQEERRVANRIHSQL